jgi:hypothetical protein
LPLSRTPACPLLKALHERTIGRNLQERTLFATLPEMKG